MKPGPIMSIACPSACALTLLIATIGLPSPLFAQNDAQADTQTIANDNRFDEAVERYTRLRQTQQYESAHKAAHEALKQADAPDRKAKAMLLLAQSFDDMEQPTQALEMYQKAQAVQDLSPGAHADAIFEEALHHARLGNEAAAIASFQRIEAVKDVPASQLFSALRAKGYAYMQSDNRDLDAARKAFADIANIKGASELQKSEGQYFLALIDRLEKNHDKARQRLEKLTTRTDLPQPVIAKYMMAMGDNYQSAGEHEKAIAVYRQLSGSEQKSPAMHSRALLMTGISAIHMGNMSLARESFEAVIAMEDAPSRYVDTARRRLQQISSQ